MSFWDKVQASAKVAGDATKVAARKAKLRADMLMIDREMENRKKAFGIAMYDHVSPLSQSQEFYAATDDLTNILRPHLINAQKEIQALAAKRVKLKETLSAAEARRAGAFPSKADNFGEKFMNFGKASAMHSSEAKTKAELAVVDGRIKKHKQSFGLELFNTLSEAEDSRGYLPSDRQVRNIYDNCRGDIQQMESNKKRKAEELKELGGSVNEETTPSVVENNNGFQSSTGDLSMQMNADSYKAPTQMGYSDSRPSNGPEDLLL